MTANQDLVQRIESSWRDLLAAIDGIPEERMVEPGAAGDWSIKDVLGHVAYWDSAAVAILRRLAAGEPAPEGEDDFEPINQREAARRADWPLQRVMAELHETHAAMLDALETSTRAVGHVDPETIAGDTYAHYDEHTAQIRAWRERQGI